ncbi:MAG: hypothetical protein JXP34_11435 [Planctomycetes bacterium]|nr:hypothetical protein [Planctomycetota bacterium]
MRRCHKCGTPWEGYGKPRYRQSCPVCGKALHSCRNCHHFDGAFSLQCRLPDTQYVGNRDDANYCESFRFRNSKVLAVENRVERARDRWERLFR